MCGKLQLEFGDSKTSFDTILLAKTEHKQLTLKSRDLKYPEYWNTQNNIHVNIYACVSFVCFGEHIHSHRHPSSCSCQHRKPIKFVSQFLEDLCLSYLPNVRKPSIHGFQPHDMKKINKRCYRLKFLSSLPKILRVNTEKIINWIKEPGLRVPANPYCLCFCGTVHVHMENMCILVGDGKNTKPPSSI